MNKYAHQFGSLIDLRGEEKGPRDIKRMFLQYCAANIQRSRAQLFQDLLALFYWEEKRGGFFVEFGATNGIDLSNTFLLEKAFHWKGILCEPARSWRADLSKNRRATIDHRCVWHESGTEVTFNETSIGEFSTIDKFTESDVLAEHRKDGSRYAVKTVSLNDLLQEHRAPKMIDYMSIDTEGSEFDILSAFDFKKYDVRLMTVEHNYTPQRTKIFELLSANGYLRIFEEMSQFDDWYMKPRQN